MFCLFFFYPCFTVFILSVMFTASIVYNVTVCSIVSSLAGCVILSDPSFPATFSTVFVCPLKLCFRISEIPYFLWLCFITHVCSFMVY